MSTRNGSARPPRLSRRVRTLVLIGLLTAIAATRVAAVFTVGVNWDEFALLDRARLTLETGVLVSGGRPGLSVVMLMPFVRDCADEIIAVRNARLAWLGITAAFLAGLGVLLARLQPDPRRRLGDALLGVGLLALVPAFLEWSIQVRADQVALAAGVWGTVALLASRRRLAWAPVAGFLFGVGLLASQKVVYVGALAAVLSLAEIRAARDLRLPRETARALLSLLVFAAVLVAFRAFTAALLEMPATHPAQNPVSPGSVGRSMGDFHFYRMTLGFSQYAQMLPTLAPHAALLAALVAATWKGLRRRAHLDALGVAWAVLLLGVAVGAFHAGAFFYFWMTLGLFPAVAFPLARGAIADLLLPDARARLAAGALIGCALVAPAAMQTAFLFVDTQSVQRESLAFVHRNFGAGSAGFHPERGPFCWSGDQPIQPFFSLTIYNDFGSPDEDRNRRRLERTLAAFHEAPVEFLVQSFRLNQFPAELRRFWSAHYQPYHASVFVAGRRLWGSSGATREFELIVPGRYRWLPAKGAGPVRIDEQILPPGGVVELTAGAHTARFVDDVPDGVLVLALADPPSIAPRRFYKVY